MCAMHALFGGSLIYQAENPKLTTTPRSHLLLCALGSSGGPRPSLITTERSAAEGIPCCNVSKWGPAARALIERQCSAITSPARLGDRPTSEDMQLVNAGEAATRHESYRVNCTKKYLSPNDIGLFCPQMILSDGHEFLTAYPIVLIDDINPEQ